MSRDSQDHALRVDDALVVPIVEERLVVGKRDVEAGRVRVRTATDVVEEMVRQDLDGFEVEVSRVPIDRLVEPGAEPPRVRSEGETTILPVFEEVLVVEKRLLLKEELHVTRRQTTETVEIPVTVRRQRAVIERIGPDGSVSTDPTQLSETKE